MELVSVENIPKKPEIEQTPLIDLMRLLKVCQQMELVCKENNGLGISAVQVGIPWKLFVAKNKEGLYDYIVDCSYEPTGDSVRANSIEGCLSLKDEHGNSKRFLLDRNSSILVRGKILKTENVPQPVIEDFDKVLTGIDSVLYQHEIDHGLGILISDIGTPINIRETVR